MRVRGKRNESELWLLCTAASPVQCCVSRGSVFKHGFQIFVAGSSQAQMGKRGIQKRGEVAAVTSQGDTAARTSGAL